MSAGEAAQFFFCLEIAEISPDYDGNVCVFVSIVFARL